MGPGKLSVDVRPATAGDLAQIAEIFGWYAAHSVATFEEAPRSVARWSRHASQLADLGLPFLVAADGPAVAGYAYAGPWRPKPAYRATVEDSVFLAPDRTGQGIGKRLLTDLIGACAKARVRQIIAVIADSGDPASERLHEACGFRHAGRLTDVGFKHGRWIDTILLQRTLAESR